MLIRLFSTPCAPPRLSGTCEPRTIPRQILSQTQTPKDASDTSLANAWIDHLLTREGAECPVVIDDYCLPSNRFDRTR